MNIRGLARLGMLAVGLSIGAAVASTPGIASADDLDFQISIDGYDLLPATDNSATASSSMGDIAIAWGDGANASATGGVGDFAESVGAGAGTTAGGDSTSNFDTAIDIGNDTGTGGHVYAVYGSDNFSYVDAANSTAYAGGNVTDSAVTGSHDFTAIIDPFGAGGDIAFSGAGLGSNPGSYDLASILFDDNASAYTATGANYLYDIVSTLGAESGTAAATSGGWLADLLSLF
jgi:hypothetical protein